MASGSQQGKSNNPHGRPKGTKNERTKEWEALGEAIVTRHADRFNSVLDDLDNEEFIKSYGMILNYFKPKLSSTNLSGEVKNPDAVKIYNAADGYKINDKGEIEKE